ncbi:metallophosphoesterase [Actinoplanes sp. L3-i22]|uniref:metallophosphoesterase n=1 Tax=Actinoplanes sp. L3-i22 TaxID=2836373 RepID=UPI002103766D|nr:metallophosphoesterase [Actinoplanes sp. L3-i22]
MAFVAVILVVIGLVHFYLWKRLVRETVRPGWARRLGAVVVGLLGLLVPATLIGVRAGYVEWLAWPGYLWIALMFYLLISLAVLEIPRLALRLLWVGKRRTEEIAEALSDRDGAADGELQPAGSVAVVAESDVPVPVGGKSATSPAEATSANVSSTAGQSSMGDQAGQRSEGGEAAATGAGGTAGQSSGGEAATTRVGGTAGQNGVGGEAAASGVNGPAAAGGEAAGGVDRRLVLARGVAIFAGLTAAGVTGYGVRTATSAPRIDRVQIPIAKLPRAMDGTRLAVVSDIHLGPLTGIGHAQRITRVINSVNADVVCVVGDLVDGTVAELGHLAEPLRGIESRRGAFFVTGNHEYYSGFEPWIEEVTELGMRPLRNARVEIDGLDLAGVNDLGGEAYGDAADFGKALGDRDTNRPVVLMAHQPLAAKDAAPYGVDLQVSGHTHGGQMAPFNLLVKLQQPVVSGFGRVDGVPVYVTNGAGFWGPPVRVGAPPQVTVVELRVA